MTITEALEDAEKVLEWIDTRLFESGLPDAASTTRDHFRRLYAFDLLTGEYTLISNYPPSAEGKLKFWAEKLREYRGNHAADSDFAEINRFIVGQIQEVRRGV